MITKRLILVTAICCLALTGFAQKKDWRVLMHEPDANFFEVQALFYAEFGDSIGPKGSGWKQFKRWEYYYQYRVDEEGNLPSQDDFLRQLKAYNFRKAEAAKYAAGTGNWEELGPVPKPNNGTGQPNGNGRLNCIAFHPTDPNTIYVGAPSGGFWKTTDHGATWAKSVSGLTRLGISSIVVDPTDPNTIFIGTGDRDGGDSPGYGVWKSTDGGATWSPSNNGMGNRTVYEIIMDPTNSQRMIAATNGSRIYRTTDGGNNWTYSFSSSSCKDIAFKPGDPNTIYASGTTFDVSTDGGVSFTQITSGVPTGVQRIALTVSANQPNWVYLLAGDGGGLNGVYRSTDSGNNFTTRATTPNILGYDVTGGTGSQAWYDLVLLADPTDANVLYTGGINIWKSTDGGATFTISAHWTGSGGNPDVHADHHALEYSTLNGNVYNGNDGGIYYSTDDGGDWIEISSGLGIAQVYKIGVAQTVEHTVINGYQDNGTAIYYDGTWSTEIGGDGMECIIDPTDESYMYGALYYGDVRRSTNGGANFSVIARNGDNGITESGGWVTPYTLDPNNASRMYIGYDNVWRSDDVKSPAANAVVWTSISSFTGTNNMVDIAVAPSNSDVVYASRSRSGERFWKTTNATAGSPVWTDLHAGLPSNSDVRDIAIDPTDENHLFIAQNNDVYESTDGGSSWTNISGTLPNLSVNTIVIDPDSPVKAMYLGQDLGVYYRDNTMSDWIAYSTNLPNVEVTELEIYSNASECTSRLFASTYGQGLWVSDLRDPGGLAPIACFETDQTDVCEGVPVTFTDNSNYSPTSWTWVVTPGTHTFENGTDANTQNPDISFSATGTYTIELTVSNANGSDTETKVNYITVSPSFGIGNYVTNFDAMTDCATTSDCGGTNCTLGDGWTNLTNGVDDDIDWRVDDSGTPSSNTGPSGDNTTGFSNYVYTEASGVCSGQTAIMESGCIALNDNFDFNIMYHMDGGNMGVLHVDVMSNGTWVEDVVTPETGDQGNVWNPLTIDLSPYNGETIKMRFRGVTGNGFESDMALDDFEFATQTPVPVELLTFDARLANDYTVNLEWSTSTEKNNDYFSVQRSNNGVAWETIGEVDGAGNSNVQVDYTYWDNEPITGTTHYRLKQVDFDGAINYSTVKVVSLAKEVITKVYPNPADQYILVEGEHVEEYTVQFTNVLGQAIIMSSQTEENKIRFNTAHLPQGVYYINVMDGANKIDFVKIIIQ